MTTSFRDEPDYSIGGYLKLGHQALSKYVSDGSSTSQSDASSDEAESPSEIETAEAAPEYDTTRLLHLARLLTSDTAFLTTDGVSTETLLNLDQAPGCDPSQSELNANPYFALVNAMTSEPPTYGGEDPIGNITMVIRQLASCQRTTGHSILSKIGDFFLRRDGGKALRQVLLASKVVIECLALWHVLQQNNMAGAPGSEDFRAMQEFCREAVSAQGILNAEDGTIPASLSKNVARAQQWDNNLATVVATFQLDSTYPAPVLLVFNEQALEEVMEATENNGSLPQQVQRDDSGTTGDAPDLSDTVPMTFVPRSQLRPFVEQYIQSGAVKSAQPIAGGDQ